MSSLPCRKGAPLTFKTCVDVRPGSGLPSAQLGNFVFKALPPRLDAHTATLGELAAAVHASIDGCAG